MNSVQVKELQQRTAIQRDEGAYRQLFLFYYSSLARFSIGFVKTKEASEEVVGDVMLNIWSLKERLAEVANLTVYLYQATRNKSLDYLRVAQRHSFQSLEDLDETYGYSMATPEETLLKDELNRKMRDAVLSLPPKCQMVYKLIREDGFTYKEVACVLDISENTVDRHLNNALHKLVKGLKGYLK